MGGSRDKKVGATERDKEGEQRRVKERHGAGSDEKGQTGEGQEGERHPQ